MDHSCDDEEIFEGLGPVGREILLERYAYMNSLKKNDSFYYVPLLAWDIYKGSNRWVCLMALEPINVKKGKKSKPIISLYQWFKKTGEGNWKAGPWPIKLEFGTRDKIMCLPRMIERFEEKLERHQSSVDDSADDGSIQS